MRVQHWNEHRESYSRGGRNAHGAKELTRAEHLAWAKERALFLVERGDLAEALTSISSDLANHAETRGSRAPAEGMAAMVDGRLRTKDEMRAFIEGIE